MADKIFERMNLGILSEVLLFGFVPEGQADTMSCEERLRVAESEVQTKLDDLDLEAQQNREVQDIISWHQARISAIYFEMGMKSGVKLYRELAGLETETMCNRHGDYTSPRACVNDALAASEKESLPM